VSKADACHESSKNSALIESRLSSRSLAQSDGDVRQAVLQRWWLRVIYWYSGEQSMLSWCPLVRSALPEHPCCMLVW
jgi:hypothetical protein